LSVASRRESRPCTCTDPPKQAILPIVWEQQPGFRQEAEGMGSSARARRRPSTSAASAVHLGVPNEALDFLALDVGTEDLGLPTWRG